MGEFFRGILSQELRFNRVAYIPLFSPLLHEVSVAAM